MGPILDVGERRLAVLCEEPEPVPILTAGPLDGHGAFAPEATLFVLADQCSADSDRLLRAFHEGRDALHSSREGRGQEMAAGDDW